MNESYNKELHNGYLDDKGVIRLCFVDGLPQKLADSFNRAEPTLSTKQARTIYDSVNGLYGQLTRKNITFDEAKVELVMLKSRINDKKNKGAISEEFYDFFVDNVDVVKTHKDFMAFTLHFEAICNYLKDGKPSTSDSYKNKGDNKYQNKNNFRR